MSVCVCGCVSWLKEVGEGCCGMKERKRTRGRMTKGGRRDGEHEVGLDRTMGLRVTFELSLRERADYGFVGKIQGRNLLYLPKNAADLRIKAWYLMPLCHSSAPNIQAL